MTLAEIVRLEREMTRAGGGHLDAAGRAFLDKLIAANANEEQKPEQVRKNEGENNDGDENN